MSPNPKARTSDSRILTPLNPSSCEFHRRDVQIVQFMCRPIANVERTIRAGVVFFFSWRTCRLCVRERRLWQNYVNARVEPSGEAATSC